jgi:hypothetical protein
MGCSMHDPDLLELRLGGETKINFITWRDAERVVVLPLGRGDDRRVPGEWLQQSIDTALVDMEHLFSSSDGVIACYQPKPLSLSKLIAL